ncbi:alpha/beta hydrolase [Paenibacillus mesophilus]|uniref:alpha/beta fold hydrolase n=1 Tax=Paenibacillus mesophilus TaxID=2582849 RepID=UPI00110E403B|nr:alpha/beta hydrolase [Paenibacillus mesophilus]TMV50911.1 alpha/beta hydrolase [Paenibacillus mesophilus]
MGFYVEVEKGVKVYVEDVGVGAPVLLIHGWPVHHEMFEYQVSQLPKYGYRCIQVDLRGFGKSDRPWTGYSYNRMADDIRVVIGTLGISHARLIGFSMGGAISIRYMSRHRGYGISQLLLLAAAAPSFTRRPGYPYGMNKEDVNALIAQNDTNRPQMLHDFGELFFASPITPSFRDWFQSLGLAASSHATAATAISLRDEDLRSDLPNVHVPTTILHGKLDKICPFPLAEQMHRGIRGSVLLPFEKSGHGIFYDELELFNHRLVAALGQIGR